ncbi:putative phage protein (TIGR02218 family) [Breoghania corrubedonensis]|uniref:Putative phage protein (TIGR02218 family) n=1 Tax=Breoghania corrubedonensis TaxID=665038 RepID=A0A2T5V1K9_9HYPH|nr:DUF2163 domain-containing protein [Breoghania corrubedonensis]PTW57649.1 putative phage protein (TIGR02218 family) [Breoghania corrubedonensis]
MKTLDPAFAAHLAAGATTLATCWKAARGDGTVLGFTDHDADIVFDGVTYLADSGPEASEATTGPGLAVGGSEIAGALNDLVLSGEPLSEADLAAGLWDRARIEVWRVNWADPAERMLMRIAEIGEVTRADGAFKAELRSLAQGLEEVRGRVFSHVCDADLGDARCGVDVETGAYRGTGIVSMVWDERRIVVAGLDGFAEDFFARGLLRWTSGANMGRAMEVTGHAIGADGAVLTLWLAPSAAITAGDGFTVSAGCDKRAATCRAKFANLINFRGFPHMPGNDFALSYPDRNTGVNDGGALVE